MNAIAQPSTTDRGTIAPLLYGEPARVDEWLRQLGRRWAQFTGLQFLEYNQNQKQQSIFAIHKSRQVPADLATGILTFGPSQPTEELNPLQYINIDVTCNAPDTEKAMALCMSFLWLVQPSRERGGFGPFVHVPRLASMRGVPGIPVEMVDLWPVTNGVLQWHGWRATVINVASPPQLIGRTGHTLGGRAEAVMSIQCMCDAITIDAPPATVQITSTNASSVVRAFALPVVGSDGQADTEGEYLHLSWRDGSGNSQSAAIDFDDNPTIAELKTAVEAHAGWTLTIDDPGGSLGIADRFARYLYSTRPITVNDTTPAMLRVAESD